MGEHAVFPGPHTLSTTAREEFEKGLPTEVRKNIEDKAMPSSIAAGLLVVLAAVNMVLACIAGFGCCRDRLQSRHGAFGAQAVGYHPQYQR
jgi:hypothetical protein